MKIERTLNWEARVVICDYLARRLENGGCILWLLGSMNM
jgi:hypothetical protein